MNIIDRGKDFLKRLQELANRTVWDWKQCPNCGSWWTIKNGGYWRHPWGFEGRERVRIQRHQCHACDKTYSETSPLLKRGSWYYRSVQRAAIDHWLHGGIALRRTAELLRSWIGHQERWRIWHPMSGTDREACHLAASTVHRWLDAAGERAVERIPDQLAEIVETQQLGTDGLWAKLTGGVTRVVLMTVDSVSGLIYPPVVARGEERAQAWEKLLALL